MKDEKLRRLKHLCYKFDPPLTIHKLTEYKDKTDNFNYYPKEYKEIFDLFLDLNMSYSQAINFWCEVNRIKVENRCF